MGTKYCLIDINEGAWSLTQIKNSENSCQSKILSMDTEKVSNSIDRGKSAVTCSPVGRLKNSMHEWEKKIGASRYILSVIENGYTLPLKTTPQKVYLKNNRSARDNPNFVSEEISNLLRKGVISESKNQPDVVNPLTVAHNKAGKPRLVWIADT